MSGDLPDKKFLYGNYQKARDWRNKLEQKLAHKALDIDMDDDVNVDNSKVGIGWKELAVIAAAGLGAAWLYTQNSNTENTQAVSPVDSEYKVTFYDAQGNLIEVPHISTKK